MHQFRSEVCSLCRVCIKSQGLTCVDSQGLTWVGSKGLTCVGSQGWTWVGSHRGRTQQQLNLMGPELVVRGVPRV
jgi:hypothetical protein